MEYLKYIREYLAGFRMPNLKKLWYGSDEVDSSSNEPILVQVRLCLKITLEMSCMDICFITWSLKAILATKFKFIF